MPLFRSLAHSLKAQEQEITEVRLECPSFNFVWTIFFHSNLLQEFKVSILWYQDEMFNLISGSVEILGVVVCRFSI